MEKVYVHDCIYKVSSKGLRNNYTVSQGGFRIMLVRIEKQRGKIMKVRVSFYAGFKGGKVRKYRSSKGSSEDRATLFSFYC